MWATTTALIGSAALVQLLILKSMAPRLPIGDEEEYLIRGASNDPHAPRLFLRPPVLPWIASQCHRIERHWLGLPSSETGTSLRNFMALLSVVTVALTFLAGFRLVGTEVAILGTLLLCVQPERIIYGCHLWPDTIIAFILTSLMVVSTLPPTPAWLFIATVLNVLGALTRIDFVVVGPVFLVSWAWAAGPLPVGAVAVVVVPLLSLAAWSLHNGRKYGTFLPDTTWAFNLSTASHRIQNPERRSIEHERVMNAVKAEWLEQESKPVQAIGWLAWQRLYRSPGKMIRQIGQRFLAMIGPDTFIHQRLLPSRLVYPELSVDRQRRWSFALRLAFPTLVAVLILTSSIAQRLPPAFVWPAFALLGVSICFQARTRYRLGALPALCLFASEQTMIALQSSRLGPFESASCGAVFLMLVIALSRIRSGLELRTL